MSLLLLLLLKSHIFLHSYCSRGTLAQQNFQNPSWRVGALLQVAGSDGSDRKEIEKGNHRFGFMWQEGTSRVQEVSVLKRMEEQDMFQWFN